MNFIESVTTCLTNYFNFNDRASRSEYWWFYLFCFLLNIVFGIIGLVIFGPVGSSILQNLSQLAILIPILAVGARRLHDTGRSGWWQLLGITIIGLIPLIIWFCTEGDKESNQFGDPIIFE